MALEVELEGLDNRFLDHVQITHNDLFVFPAGEEIALGDLLSVVNYHRLHIRPKYKRDRRYYEGKHDIFNMPPKESYKPDNRLVVNFPRKAVTQFNGFFNGTPVKIDHPQKNIDTTIERWENVNNFEDTMSEVSKDSSIYGRAYFYIYQDETGQPCAIACSPLDTFLIYDDTKARRVKYGVQYSYNVQGQLTVTLISNQYQREFIMDSNSGTYLSEQSAVVNPYPIVPIVEAPENEERMALCADIYTLFDELDKAMSEKANDVDYFADAYLKIVNAYMSEDEQKEFSKGMRDNRLAVVNGSNQEDADIGFMAKPDADATQENLINRLVDDIYQVSNVVNMNDEAFAGNPAGVTLQLKYQPMKDMAGTKSSKFKKALRDVFQCVFATLGDINGDAWQDLEFKFTQNVPQNLLEEAQALSYLWGRVSNKTALAQMPFVEDPDKELDQIKQEKADAQQQTTNIVQNALTDQQQNPQQQSQQTGGVNNDQPAAGTQTNSTTNQPGQPNGSRK